MPDALGALLALLPDDPAGGSDAAIALDGLLLRTSGGIVRLAVGPVCLDFAVVDLIAVDERPGAAGGPMALPVRLHLRPGARLLAAAPAAPYEALLHEDPLPFAYATRPDPPDLRLAPGFAAREAAFRRRNGLE